LWLKYIHLEKWKITNGFVWVHYEVVMAWSTLLSGPNPSEAS
jgi:hypothetical protein